jgi:hypothetical protein
MKEILTEKLKSISNALFRFEQIAFYVPGVSFQTAKKYKRYIMDSENDNIHKMNLVNVTKIWAMPLEAIGVLDIIYSIIVRIK